MKHKNLQRTLNQVQPKKSPTMFFFTTCLAANAVFTSRSFCVARDADHLTLRHAFSPLPDIRRLYVPLNGREETQLAVARSCGHDQREDISMIYSGVSSMIQNSTTQKKLQKPTMIQIFPTLSKKINNNFLRRNGLTADAARCGAAVDIFEKCGNRNPKNEQSRQHQKIQQQLDSFRTT